MKKISLAVLAFSALSFTGASQAQIGAKAQAQIGMMENFAVISETCTKFARGMQKHREVDQKFGRTKAVQQQLRVLTDMLLKIDGEADKRTYEMFEQTFDVILDIQTDAGAYIRANAICTDTMTSAMTQELTRGSRE